MKRSTMVQKMFDHWMGLFNDVPKDLEDEIKERMDGLLKTVEYYGMVPPTNGWTTSGCCHTLREMCNCPAPTPKNEWDKE